MSNSIDIDIYCIVQDWKRSIRHAGKSMKLLLTKGILSTHPPICDCEGCRMSSPVVSLQSPSLSPSLYLSLFLRQSSLICGS